MGTMKSKERKKKARKILEEYGLLNTCEFCRLMNDLKISDVAHCTGSTPPDYSTSNYNRGNPYPTCTTGKCKIGWRKNYYTLKTMEGTTQLTKRYYDRWCRKAGNTDLMTKFGMAKNYPTLDQWF